MHRNSLRQQLAGSPISKRSVQLVLLFVAVCVVLIAQKSFIKYYTQAPLEMLVAIGMGVVLYIPTFFYLACLTRRHKKNKALYFVIPLVVICLIGPATGAANGFFLHHHLRTYQFVGVTEEIAKIIPLLLILWLAKPLIKDVRDGVFFGALGGLGFTVLEMGAYFALLDYPKTGWDSFWENTVSRATFLGFDTHIFWSAFLGGAIVFGLSSPKKILQFLIPITCFLLVAATHCLQDSTIGKIISVLPLGLLEPLFVHWGVTEEALKPFMIPMTVFSSTVSLFLINILIWPFFIYMLKHNRKVTA